MMGASASKSPFGELSRIMGDALEILARQTVQIGVAGEWLSLRVPGSRCACYSLGALDTHLLSTTDTLVGLL